ncbi:MAG TPA: uracil phosphoribosyltransferase [Opitutaceae bacterium]|jgi:uracil phosphoribosyltransferase
MLRILDHPLAAHILTHLRDKTTKPATFRALAYQLTLMLAIDATRDLATEEKAVETPLETATGRILAHQPIVVVAILRAGVSMVQPFLDIFPDVSVGYVGLERDHVTAVARNYYSKLPPLEGRRVFLVDPMLATGGSAAQALSVVKDKGARNPRLVCIIAAPEGVAEVARHHPETSVHVGVLDRGLNERKYILPGLGDFGDRLYGT